jgi:transcriptional regulator with XRE-family HTH domain
MALQLDVSQRAYSKMEREEIKLDWERIQNIAGILEIEPVDLVSFDDSLIFHNCQQSGKANTINNNFPIELKKQYEARIQHLTKEIAFLRKQISEEYK